MAIRHVLCGFDISGRLNPLRLLPSEGFHATGIGLTDREGLFQVRHDLLRRLQNCRLRDVRRRALGRGM